MIRAQWATNGISGEQYSPRIFCSSSNAWVHFAYFEILLILSANYLFKFCFTRSFNAKLVTNFKIQVAFQAQKRWWGECSKCFWIRAYLTRSNIVSIAVEMQGALFVPPTRSSILVAIHLPGFTDTTKTIPEMRKFVFSIVAITCISDCPLMQHCSIRTKSACREIATGKVQRDKKHRVRAKFLLHIAFVSFQKRLEAHVMRLTVTDVYSIRREYWPYATSYMKVSIFLLAPKDEVN